MRQNKWAILVGTPLTIVALFIAWAMNDCGKEFWCNVFLGVFGSGLLTVFVSIINYLTERRRTLEAFWSYGHKAIRNLNQYSQDDNLDIKIDVLLQMNEFDYQPFDDAFGEISFVFHHKKTIEEIGKRIYGPIWEVRNALSKCAYHFKLYKKAEHGNKRVMEDYTNEIDKLLIKRSTYNYQGDDGSGFIVSKSETFKVHILKMEFNNYFYKVMYPWKKVEEEDNAD